jgi:hypothetical protein
MHDSPFQYFGDGGSLEADLSTFSGSLRTHLETASSSFKDHLRRQILHGIIKGGRHRQKGAMVAGLYATSMRRDLHRSQTEELSMQGSLGHSPKGGSYFASTLLRTSSSSSHRKRLHQIQEALSNSLLSLHAAGDASDPLGGFRDEAGTGADSCNRRLGEGEVTTASIGEVMASPVRRAQNAYAQQAGQRYHSLVGSPFHRALSAPSPAPTARLFTPPHGNSLDDVHGLMMSGQLQLPKVLIPTLVTTEQSHPQSRFRSTLLQSPLPRWTSDDEQSHCGKHPASSCINPTWSRGAAEGRVHSPKMKSSSPRLRGWSPGNSRHDAPTAAVDQAWPEAVWELNMDDAPIRREARFLNRTVAAASAAAVERDVQKLPPWPLTRSLLS